MVNMVRLEGGKLAEMWFGMDPLVEMQLLGVAPPPAPAALTPMAEANLTAFGRTVSDDGTEFDNVAPFDDVVVAISPSQAQPDTTTRRVEIYRFDDDAPTRVYEHELITNPPYGGDPTAIGDVSRTLVERWITKILCDRADRLDRLATPADPPDRHAGLGHLSRHHRRLSVADTAVDGVPRPHHHRSLHRGMPRHRRRTLDCDRHKQR